METEIIWRISAVECGMLSMRVISYLLLFIYLSLNKPGHPVCTLSVPIAPSPTAARLGSARLSSALAAPARLSSPRRPACVNARLCLSGPLLYMRIAGHYRGNSWQASEYMCFCRDQLSYVSNAAAAAAAAAQLRAAPHIWPALESLAPPLPDR